MPDSVSTPDRAFNFGMGKQRNSSRKIRNGTVLRTRDAYLPGGERSPHEKEYADPRKLYRRVFVVATNSEDEVAIIEVQSKGVLIRKDGSIRDKHNGIVHVTFRDGSPLRKTNGKLEKHKADADYSEQEALEALKYAVNVKNPKTAKAMSNRAKLKSLKKKKRG